MTSRLVIENGFLITMDAARGDIPRGDVLIEDGVIREVGPSLCADDCERIDAGGMIVLPGFVDTHRHVWQTQLRGLAADWTLLDYVVEMRYVLGSLYGADDAYLGNYAGALEALDGGVTTLVDHSHIVNSPDHADEAVRGLEDSGVRAVFCYGMYANPARGEDGTVTSAGFDTPAWHFEDARRLRATRLAVDDARVTMGIALNEVEPLPLEHARAEIELAREVDAALISVHVGMGALSRGRRFVAHLRDAGLLDARLLFVHGSALDDDELSMAADAGAAFSSTPDTELQMGMGWPVAWRARAANASASLGADIVSNVGGDLFGQMRLALQCERARRNADLEARGVAPARLDLFARDVLELATIGGARAARVDRRVGSLTPGKQADIVVVRCDRVGMQPLNDPCATIVFYATSGDVDTVLVGGRVVKRAGVLVSVERERLRDRLDRSRERILARARTIPRGDIRAAVAAFFPVE